jgi:HTH-type transcriptional regulator / antitoxin HigA
MRITKTDMDESAYSRLLKRTLPRVIRTDEKLAVVTEELIRLDERENLLPEEKELAELLTVLIGEYEERRYPIRKASPQQTLKHLMEARKLTQKDLWKVFESKGITSEVFHGKRAISKAQARRLAEFFHVSIELFI